MKFGAKLWILWLASMALFISVGIATWLTMDVMDGISGLTIRFFLGYCGIIIVCQVLAALSAIRDLINELSEKKPVSTRVMLR